MYSVGIVDDEKLVTFGIQSLLTEDNSPFLVCGVWHSGAEALSSCLRNPPDFLLTDLGMPGMGGLELIREIRQNKLQTRIVVLSCHDEYDLVHKAFKLGADDYILKQDVDKERLFEVLGSILPDDETTLLPSQSDTGIPRISQISHDFIYSGGCLGVMGFKKDFDESGLEISWHPDIPMLYQVVQDCVSPNDNCYLGNREDLVIQLSKPDSEVYRDAVDPRLERIRSVVSRYLNRKVFIAQTGIRPDPDYEHIYQNGLGILDGMFYEYDSCVLLEAQGVVQNIEALSFTLSSDNFEQSWMESFDRYIANAISGRLDPDTLRTDLVFAVKHLLFHLQDNRAGETVSVNREGEAPYPLRISQFADIQQMVQWTKQYLSRIASYLKADNHKRSHIDDVKSYIYEHLDNDLRLSIVADAHRLNPNYLSNSFKKETGESYIDYVNRKRIGKACELLETTGLAAKEIAFRCGYQNPNYFSRVFKKTCGCTISEFRNDHLQ